MVVLFYGTVYTSREKHICPILFHTLVGVLVCFRYEKIFENGSVHGMDYGIYISIRNHVSCCFNFYFRQDHVACFFVLDWSNHAFVSLATSQDLMIHHLQLTFL